MESMDRRTFVNVAGAAGALSALAASAPIVARASASEGATDADNDTELVGSTPAGLAAMGGSAMSLRELNRRRHELVDSKGDYTCEDGTVVPAVWHKLRTLFDTYGNGCGDTKYDDTFDFYQMLFTEDEAQAYLEMPYGVLFTAAEFAAESGRDEDECLALCEDLATRGLLWRARRGGVAYFHQIAVVHGIFEYNLNNYYEEGWIPTFMNSWLNQAYEDNIMLTAGTPFYYAIPCDKDIVADEQVLLLDDFEKLVERNELMCVAPCQCRLMGMVAAGEPAPEIGSEELKDFMSPVCGHPLETCMIFGEEAEYYLERGVARQIDKDEALAIMRRSVEDGMILQSCFTKGSEIVCSCHGDCCGILAGYLAAGPDVCAESEAYLNASNYNLVYDREACIQCGACAERCPMYAITMDEDGYPTVNATCMRCGQCGMVCPVGARTLEAKPADERLEMPGSLLEDYNLKASFRFDHETIH